MFSFCKFFRSKKNPPPYDIIPSYNEAVNTTNSQSDVCPSYKESAASPSPSSTSFDKELSFKELGTDKYIIINSKNCDLKNIVSQIVSNNHSNITLYTITNDSNTNYNITIGTDVIELTKGNNIAIIGLSNLSIKFLNFTVIGNKYGTITPECNSFILNNNKPSIVYNHIAAFKNNSNNV